PLTMYLIFANLPSFTGEARQVAALYTMVSLSGFGAIGAVLNNGASLVTDRTLGWLRQLRLTPLSPLRVVTAKALISMIVASLPIAAICLAGATIVGVRLSLAQWLGVVTLLWLGTAPFAALGLGIGYLCTAQTAQPATFLAYFGMSILGGLWLPLQAFPHL